MKPVSLRLHAFGSYAGELQVDFARLSRHGIFAITGPTGAGKSTIFDALVYALYDDLPGFRIDGNVRSQFADPQTPTSVSLDFVVHGQRWRVERRPTQLLARSRHQEAGALRETVSKVVLGRVRDDGELFPGTVVTRKQDAKRKIDELVGLTKDQFEQVVLIPQGRFEEVLKADTQKRAPLLRRLFPVEVFTQVTDRLRSIAAAHQLELEEAERARRAVLEQLEGAYAAAVAQLPDHLRVVLLGDSVVDARAAGTTAGTTAGTPTSATGGRWDHAMEQLGHDVSLLTESLRRVDELVGTLASRADFARACLDDARRAAADWDDWQADLVLAAGFEEEERADARELAAVERARRLADLRGALAEWDEATRRLARLEPDLADLAGAIGSAWPEEVDAVAWDSARDDAYEAGLLAQRLAADGRRLDAEIGRFERLVVSGRSLGDRQRALEERRIELAERTLKLDVEEQAIDVVAEEVQTLRADAAALDAHAAALSALERERDMAARRAAAFAELERLDATLAAASVAATRASARADAVRVSWREGLSGRLARLLEDGEPCPTCGSLDHPAPAEWRGEGAGDGELDAAEREREEALRLRAEAGQGVAAARGAVDALAESRPLGDVEADLAACREAVRLLHHTAQRLAVVTAEERRRRSALRDECDRLAANTASLGADAARVDAEAVAHRRGVDEFLRDHGRFESPAARAAARISLAGDVEQFAGLLREAEEARGALRHCSAVVAPVVRQLDAKDPAELLGCVLEPAELEERAAALEERRSRREDVRRRIAEYEASVGAIGEPAGAVLRPDVESLDALAHTAVAEHVALVERRAVLADRVSVLAGGPAAVAQANERVATARVALEQARTVANRCAGLGGGPDPVRLSLENWVLADYLRQVLLQANQRLDAMTGGRFALELCDGVTDGRKPWGLDLAVFDANTGQVRPATTLSGGETFMAALALALGLADVVSGGSNREVGALFVDEGFGSLDPQSLDAVVDVLRGLEDGGRIVGVISHVRELQQALPSGITVEPTVGGSLAMVHYPPE